MQPDLMNAVFLLSEIKHALVDLKNEGKKKVINLSNFPLSNDEARFIDEKLGRGEC